MKFWPKKKNAYKLTKFFSITVKQPNLIDIFDDTFIFTSGSNSQL
jgi:hypothetical protein